MHNQASFLTLTYETMPADGCISMEHHQKFIRALRKKLKKKIRFYMCAEYGPQLDRPHYHYLIFGHDFTEDRYYWTTHNGHKYFRSPELEKVWDRGFSLVGNVSWESAAYCARYIMKKQNGPKGQEHYQRPHPSIQGQTIQLTPEFCRMSLKPGIGADWFAQYGYTDVYDSGDFVTIAGKKYKTPRYYDKLLDDLDERQLVEVKQGRETKAARNAANQTPARLLVQETIQNLKIEKLSRGLENGNTQNICNL